MTMKKKMIVGITMIAAVALLFSIPAMAQGPERGTGNRFPGVPGGTYGSTVLNNPTDIIVGALIGGLLIYAIENNRNHDEDHYYSNRDRQWDGDWDRDHRPPQPRNHRNDDRYNPRYDRDRRW